MVDLPRFDVMTKVVGHGRGSLYHAADTGMVTYQVEVHYRPCVYHCTSRGVLVRLRKKSTEAEPKACFNDGVVNGYLVTVSYSKFTAGFSIFSIFLYFFKKKSKN